MLKTQLAPAVLKGLQPPRTPANSPLLPTGWEPGGWEPGHEGQLPLPAKGQPCTPQAYPCPKPWHGLQTQQPQWG